MDKPGELSTVTDKLDKIIESQTQLAYAQAAMMTRLEALEKVVEDLYTTVRGHNGTPGLVTEVALVRQALSNNGISEKSGTNSGQAVVKHPVDKNQITETRLMEKLGWPLATTFLFWFLYDILPKIIVTINKNP